MNVTRTSDEILWRRILWGIASVPLGLALLFGVPFLVDVIWRPWAYGLAGSGSPEGQWVGQATLKDGKPYRIRLFIEHVRDLRHTLNADDLDGQAESCTPGAALFKSDLRGSVAWRGTPVKLNVTLGAGLGKPAVTCTPSADVLSCALVYAGVRDEKVRAISKRLGRETEPKTVALELRRVAVNANGEAGKLPDLCAP